MVTKKRDIATEEIVATEIENLDSKIDANKDFVEIEETYSDSDERKDDSSDNEEIEGWADAMRKVLSKTGPKNAETMILAKESLPKENTELKKERTERKNRVSFVFLLPLLKKLFVIGLGMLLATIPTSRPS